LDVTTGVGTVLKSVHCFGARYSPWSPEARDPERAGTNLSGFTGEGGAHLPTPPAGVLQEALEPHEIFQQVSFLG
jgi:hypothetical protein